jgi:hypothetical protein
MRNKMPDHVTRSGQATVGDPESVDTELLSRVYVKLSIIKGKRCYLTGPNIDSDVHRLSTRGNCAQGQHDAKVRKHVPMCAASRLWA